MIISIFLTAIGIGIAFWCEPYLEGTNRIIFGIFLFLWVSIAVIIALTQERNVKKRIESLEQRAIKTYEWANCVMNILSPMADSVQTHDRILKEICNEVRENDK